MRLFVLVVALLTKATALIVSGAGAVNNHAINVLTSVSLPLDVDGCVRARSSLTPDCPAANPSFPRHLARRRRVMLHLAAGDDPSEAAAAFLAEHG